MTKKTTGSKFPSNILFNPGKGNYCTCHCAYFKKFMFFKERLYRWRQRCWGVQQLDTFYLQALVWQAEALALKWHRYYFTAKICVLSTQNTSAYGVFVPSPLTGVRRRSSLESFVYRPHKLTCFYVIWAPVHQLQMTYSWRNLCPSVRLYVCPSVCLSVFCCVVYPCLSVCTGHSVCNIHAFIHRCTYANGYLWMIVTEAAECHQHMSRVRAASWCITIQTYDRSRQ